MLFAGLEKQVRDAMPANGLMDALGPENIFGTAEDRSGKSIDELQRWASKRRKHCGVMQRVSRQGRRAISSEF